MRQWRGTVRLRPDGTEPEMPSLGLTRSQFVCSLLCASICFGVLAGLGKLMALEPTSLSGSIESLADAAIAFGLASLVLAILAALILHGLYELGLRGVIQRSCVIRWLRFKADPDLLAEAAGFSKLRPLFSMPYRQLCGQLAVALQDSVSAKTHHSSDHDEKYVVLRNKKTCSVFL